MFLGLEREELIKSQNILTYFRNVNCRELYKEFIESAIEIKNEKDNNKEIEQEDDFQSYPRGSGVKDLPNIK